jgi:hypothetical protein
MYRLIVVCVMFTYSHALNTDFFEHNWLSKGNRDYLFFDNRTFGINYPIDPCTLVDSMDFRAYVNNATLCRGLWCVRTNNSTSCSPPPDTWCVRGTFSCMEYNNVLCYNPTHIIHPNDLEFSEYSGNVIANLVMVYGEWSQELGSLSRIDYTAVIKEKLVVYGVNMTDRVRQTIRQCNIQLPRKSYIIPTIIACIIGCLIFIYAIPYCCRFIAKHCFPTK